ncbi:MAG TPA: OmpA family protein [Syntrophales bacterium]|nr:OmpA family protein [Syntrophales bacterium]
MKKIYLAVILASFLSWQPVCAQDAATWIEKGDILEEQEIHAEAVEAYTKAIEYDPNSADAYLKRGMALFAERKTNCSESLSDLSKAIQLAPGNAEAYFQRGSVNYYMINNEQGLKDMQTAAALGHAGARDWLAKTKATSTESDISSTMQAIIYFDHDRADIQPSYRKLLKDVGTALTNEPGLSIVLSGHADSTGTEEYNDALSLKRANVVKEYIVEHSSVSPERIAVKAYGESMPVASNDNKEDRALNRRVEFNTNN